MGVLWNLWKILLIIKTDIGLTILLISILDFLLIDLKGGNYENEVFEEGAAENANKTGYAYEYYRKLSEYTGWKYEYV